MACRVPVADSEQINALARGAAERMRTLLPDCYHFIAALIAAAALPSSCLNMCVYTLSVMAGIGQLAT